MALIKCPECSNEVSDAALTCPKCGVQLGELQRSLFGKIVKFLFIAFNILMLLWLITGLGAIDTGTHGSDSEAYKAGAAIGTGIAMFMILGIWTFGDVILGMLFLFTKPKLRASKKEYKIFGFNPWKFSGVCLLLLFLPQIIISSLHKSDSTPAATPPSSFSPASQSSSSDKWSVSPITSKMTEAPGVALTLEADEPIQAWLKNPTPELYVRCQEGKTEVAVITGAAPNPELGNYNKATVRLRMDKKPPISETWSESTDNEALFSSDAITLARQMANAETMTFEFVPFHSSAAVATFSVKGLSSHLGEVAKDCGWKYP